MQSVVFRDESIPLGENLLGGNCAGYTYTCATCGQQWGRVEIAPGQAGKTWINSTWPCENHGNSFNRGGSFLHRVSWLDYSSSRALEESLKRCGDGFLRHEVRMIIMERIGK